MIGRPPAPCETPGTTAFAFEQPPVPVSGPGQKPPPPAATPVINLAGDLKASIREENEAAEVREEEAPQLSQETPQATLKQESGSSGTEAIPAADAHEDALSPQPSGQPKPTEASADGLASVAVPDIGSDTAAPSKATEPEPQQEGVSIRTPAEPAVPSQNASKGVEPERSADPKNAPAPRESSSDEATDVLPAGGIGEPRPPSRYRPRLRERTGTASLPSNSSLRPSNGTGMLDADLMLIFQPGGWDIAVSLLLRRADGIPEETAIRIGGEVIQALAIDETYFEPLPLIDIASALQDGIAIETAGAPRRRWVRTGRLLHVFSERPGLPGFASVPRAVIGQENVILCADAISASVLTFCEATGASAPVEVTGPSVADGWHCFRGYRPKHPAVVDAAEEILLALNPRPDAAIDLSGGISIGRGKWIADRPPAIRIVGIEVGEGEVKIDGQPSNLDGTGWTAPGWNQPGQHVVRYGGLSRSYDIVELEDQWPEWPAHPRQQFSACGAAVSGKSGGRAVILSMSGCWLLGAEPGQVQWASPSLYGFAIACPAFEPVWAIPARIGHTRPIPRLLNSKALPRQATMRTSSTSVRQWRQLLRDAPAALDEPEADILWQLYRHASRALKTERRR